MDNRTVGILGGGQLGRMMVEAASRLNINTIILEKGASSPAKQINSVGEHVDGSFTSAKDIEIIAGKCDVLTIEIEHVDVSTLKKIQKTYPNLVISPSPETIELIQDKYLQKTHLIKNGVSCVESYVVEKPCKETLLEFGTKLGYPYMLKSRTFAYDGRGNYVVKDKSHIDSGLEFFSATENPFLYVEKWCPFVKELAAMVVRSHNNQVYSYPVVETIHQDNICHVVYAPAPVPDSLITKAKILAETAVKSFTGAGIFGVEMFYLENGDIKINEIAPRPHNSGHYTIDACVTSQFEAHFRSILDLPMPKDFTNFATVSTNAVMLNVLGDKNVKDKELEVCRRALNTSNTSVYLYGKESKPQRKLGHINIVSSSMDDCKRKLAMIMEDSSATKNNERCPGCVNSPLVEIIMGSDSDLPVMAAACKVLKEFEVPFEVTIVSAHRTPYRMTEFALQAPKKGVKAIIAGAGGAAHLPGMVAAMTPLPVIGVPVKGSTLDGVDSLHSIVQMPRGIPVATVAINNSTNAALLAIRLLAAYDPKYFTKMQAFMQKQEAEVLVKAEKLETIGYEKYLDQM